MVQELWISSLKKCSKGLIGRGARGKTIVFGLFKRNGRVYTEIVPDCSKRTLQGIIRGGVELESVIHSDGWRGYDGLVDLGYQKHFRVEHGNNEFANERSHIRACLHNLFNKVCRWAIFTKDSAEKVVIS